MYTMSMRPKTHLKLLSKIWPMHTAAPVAWLKEQGFSRSLIQKYISSGWMHPLAHGVVIRPDDHVEWSGLVWGVCQMHAFHIGGITALELQGKAHFVKLQEPRIFLFSRRGIKVPLWVKSTPHHLIHVATNIFPNSVGLKEHNFGEYSLKISNPARAFLEYMYLLEPYHSFEEAFYLMENLSSLLPEMMQEALQNCTSIKVKRLVLCLAKKQDVPWFHELKLSQINLGTGVRQGFKNGIYNPEFQITYPKSWEDKEDEILF